MLQRMIVITQLLRYNDYYRAWGVDHGRIEFLDHFPVKLTWESFTFSSSDYDMGDDLIECPCGEWIKREPPGTVGSAVQQAKQHLREKHGIED